MAKRTRADQTLIDDLERQLGTARGIAAQYHDRLEAESALVVDLRNRLHAAERKAERYQASSHAFEIATARAEGWKDRVREEDGRREGRPVQSAAAPAEPITSKPSVAQLLDWYEPPELVDIGLGADEEDLEAGRLGSDVLR